MQMVESEKNANWEKELIERKPIRVFPPPTVIFKQNQIPSRFSIRDQVWHLHGAKGVERKH